MRIPATGLAQHRLIHEIMPSFDVAERHEILVRAPAELTWQAAVDLRLDQSRLVRAIIFARSLPARLTGHAGTRAPGRLLLEETQSRGWRIVASRDRELVMGAVTQPWKRVVQFRGMPREEFVGFNEPGCAAIAWTLEVLALEDGLSLFRTETRVRTTSDDARRRFRRYWRLVVPGIVTIRHVMLRLVRRDAERRYRARALA